MASAIGLDFSSSRQRKRLQFEKRSQIIFFFSNYIFRKGAATFSRMTFIRVMFLHESKHRRSSTEWNHRGYFPQCHLVKCHFAVRYSSKCNITEQLGCVEWDSLCLVSFRWSSFCLESFCRAKCHSTKERGCSCQVILIIVILFNVILIIVILFNDILIIVILFNVILINAILFNVILIYAILFSVECHFALCHSAKCHSTEKREGFCHVILMSVVPFIVVLINVILFSVILLCAF